uniref:Uncharacterized protein n=1 Tax=Lactuca sativa TaxID=4236 RepID=A0A9R1XCV7_LACSA|nr:hypothetical protein LSAT_V11C500274150 [Lactuca sativa]
MRPPPSLFTSRFPDQQGRYPPPSFSIAAITIEAPQPPMASPSSIALVSAYCFVDEGRHSTTCCRRLGRVWPEMACDRCPFRTRHDAAVLFFFFCSIRRQGLTSVAPVMVTTPKGCRVRVVYHLSSWGALPCSAHLRACMTAYCWPEKHGNHHGSRRFMPQSEWLATLFDIVKCKPQLGIIKELENHHLRVVAAATGRSVGSGICQPAAGVESAGLQQCGIVSMGLQQCESLGLRDSDIFLGVSELKLRAWLDNLRVIDLTLLRSSCLSPTVIGMSLLLEGLSDL